MKYQMRLSNNNQMILKPLRTNSVYGNAEPQMNLNLYTYKTTKKKPNSKPPWKASRHEVQY